MNSMAPSAASGEQALRTAADRTGYAFACSFSTSEEYEADIIRERRAQGAYGRTVQREAFVGWLMLGTGVAVLALVFLMV